jgi:dihydrofolate reductase
LVKGELKRIIIAAVSANGIIGRCGEIPWKNKSEIAHFKNTTFGYPILMGGKTFRSLKKKLPGRLNIVISKSMPEISTDNELMIFRSAGDAYDFLRKRDYKKVFIGGGGIIYRSSIKYAEEMIISHMDLTAEGNIKFPEFNKKNWEIVKNERFKDFTVKHYLRKNN